jgi:hypothetical protein
MNEGDKVWLFSEYRLAPIEVEILTNLFDGRYRISLPNSWIIVSEKNLFQDKKELIQTMNDIEKALVNKLKQLRKEINSIAKKSLYGEKEGS